MARRGSSVKELQEKRKKLSLKVNNSNKTYEQNRAKNTESNKKIVEKKKSTSTMTAKERAQAMAKKRIAAKKAGTYKAPKTAQQLAKERIAKKKKK